MRIVYREAPEKFKLLRSVDHLHPQHLSLNQEYETWQADFIKNHKGQAMAKGKQQSLFQRDLAARKQFFGQ